LGYFQPDPRWGLAVVDWDWFRVDLDWVDLVRAGWVEVDFAAVCRVQDPQVPVDRGQADRWVAPVDRGLVVAAPVGVAVAAVSPLGGETELHYSPHPDLAV
jgi:hypothetical protein